MAVLSSAWSGARARQACGTLRTTVCVIFVGIVLASSRGAEAQSCGELGGDYCSPSGSCPVLYSSLGQTWDCNPCCLHQGPSCGEAGGGDAWCSQNGQCPAGYDSLGRTYDCNPCCDPHPQGQMSYSVYNGAGVGPTSVYANSTVIDNSTGCSHSNYSTRTRIYSPSGRSATGQAAGLGASASLAIAGEFGDYTCVTDGSNNCSCIGIASFGGGGETVPVKPTITGPDTVWYFNGATPSGYATAITLTSSGGASTQWTVVAGGDKVTLSNTSGTSTTLTSSVYSFSTSVGDIKITATASGFTSDQFGVTSRTPHRLVPGTVVTICDPTWVYETDVSYTIQDRLLTNLPTDVAINELWTTPVTDDYAGTNWRPSDQNSITTQGASFYDQIGGELASMVPTPTCDLNSTPVQHWGQAFYIGSLNFGNGRRVQTNTLQKYRGRAAHTGITSPATP